MSTNTLIEKITAEAGAEAAKISAASEAQVAEVRRETEVALEALRSDAAATLKKKQEQQERVVVAKATQEGKLKLQEAKRTLLDEVFAEVATELVEQSADDYVAFFTKQAEAVVPKDIEVSSVSAPSAREKETKDILGKLGIKADVTTDDSIKAGFIVNASDGVYDVTFHRLYSLIRPSLEMELATEFLS